jgi:3-deoxy-D-manno-octulosonic-acid transferase
VWLLASSHAGEEAIALQAHAQLRAQHADALLIIVPRDAFRGAEIVALAQAKTQELSSVMLRSQNAQLVARAEHSVYVADTMGELPLWYTLSPIALIGGSLVPVGGHNPFEARAACCQVLSGPHVHNFSESYEELQQTAGARMVHNASEIAACVAQTWLAQSRQTDFPQLATAATSTQMPALLANILQTLQKAEKA